MDTSQWPEEAQRGFRELAPLPNEDYSSYRKRRHKATEAIRRRRINSSIAQLKEMLGFGGKIDQATVLDAAVNALEEIQADPVQASAAAVAVSMPLISSSELDDVLGRLPSEPSQPSSSPFPLSASDSTSLFDASISMMLSDPFDLSQSMAPPLPSWSAIPNTSSQTTLQLETMQSSTSNLTGGLDSKHLPTNLSMLIMSNTMQILDMNQASADLLGLSSPQAGTGKLTSDLLAQVQDDDFAQLSLELLTGQRQTLTTVRQVIVRATGRVLWLRATAMPLDTRPVEQDIRRFLMICQPVEEPDGGLAHVLD
eukprot:m.28881 g.28881  ORF g.28881 m.28881 type:complete len:311 (-) comp11891_c0_seq2:33-965(-)